MAHGPRLTQPRTRHVYVRLPFNPTELPGLVLEWRRTEDRWEALVVYYREDESRAVTTWLDAHQLRPVPADVPDLGEPSAPPPGVP